MTLALDLSGRVVLVTGGTRGIGLGIARGLPRAGAHVVTCARSEVEGAADHHVCDVRDPEQVEALVAAVVERHGRLDVLVNNAGGAPNADAATALAAVPRQGRRPQPARPLLRRPGRQRRHAAAGDRRLDRQHLLGGRAPGGPPGRGVRRCEGRPRRADPVARRRVGAEGAGQRDRRRALPHRADRRPLRRRRPGGRDRRTIPLGRMADPVEVGHVAVFLASDLASYVSGARVACDGGGEPPVFLHTD